MTQPEDTTRSQPVLPDAPTVRAWLVHYLAALIQVSIDEIATDDQFAVYGLDSSAAVGLAGDLSIWLGLQLEPDLAYRFPTIDLLTEYLLREVAQR